MNYIKQILHYPTKKVLIIAGITMIVYVALESLTILLMRLEHTVGVFGAYPSTKYVIMSFIQTIVGDFAFLSRLLLELSVIVLIGKIIRKLTGKK